MMTIGAFDVPRARALASAEAPRAARGTRDAPLHSMKAALLIAFLALGPALADQTPVVPPNYRNVTVPVSAERLRTGDRVAVQAPLSDSDRARLCGGGS